MRRREPICHAYLWAPRQWEYTWGAKKSKVGYFWTGLTPHFPSLAPVLKFLWQRPCPKQFFFSSLLHIVWSVEGYGIISQNAPGVAVRQTVLVSSWPRAFCWRVWSRDTGQQGPTGRLPGLRLGPCYTSCGEADAGLGRAGEATYKRSFVLRLITPVLIQESNNTPWRWEPGAAVIKEKVL